jgi:hypothetical protein
VVDHLDGDAAARGAREGPRDGRVQRGPGGLVDVGAEGALELVVWIVGAQEVGVADEELLVVVGGVDEPAGDVVGRVAANDAGRRVIDVEPMDLDVELPDPACRRANVDVGLAEDGEQVAGPGLLEELLGLASAGFIRTVRTVSLPKRMAAPS